MSESSEVEEEEVDNETSSSSNTKEDGDDTDDTSWTGERSVKKSTPAFKPARIVTNGFGFNEKTSKCVFMVNKVNPVNETALAQHQFSPPFILLCAAWSERCKPHYFHESAHVVQSTADELKMSLSDYLFVHGWTVSRKTAVPSRPFGIRYTAFQKGLDLFEERGIIQSFEQKSMLIFRFHSLICKLEAFLCSKKGVDSTGSVTQPLTDVAGVLPATIPNKYWRKGEWMEHSSSLATRSLRPPLTLIHKINAFSQHYHLCVSVVHIIFGKAIGLTEKKNVYQWVHRIFEECHTHRKVLQGLINLCLLYPTEEVIAAASADLREALGRPHLILVNTERRVKGKSLEEYHSLLLTYMNDLFPKSSLNYIHRSTDKNNAIIRLRIIELMQNLNGGSNKRKRGGPLCHPELVPVPDAPTPTTNTTPEVISNLATEPLPVDPVNPARNHPACSTMAQFFCDMTPNFEQTALELVVTGASDNNPSLTQTEATNLPTTEHTPRLTTDSISRKSFESNLEHRFLSKPVRPVNTADILAIRPQLVVEDHLGGIRYVMDCTGFEFYVNSSLRSRRHRFTYKDEEPTLDAASSELVLLHVPPRRSLLKDPDFIVLRHGHAIVNECFNGLSIPFGEYAYLICNLNNTCSSRDGGSFNGYRMDWGTPDHSYDTSIVRHRDVPCPPVAFCGRVPFESPNGTHLTQITGLLFDRIQVAMDLAYKELKARRVYDDPIREMLFAGKIREWFGGNKCRGEWMTVQLKCISRRDKTLEHVDSKNCPTPNYDVTAAFCVMFYDAYDTMWSLKFILNSRAAPGHYLDKEITYSRLIAVIKSHTDNLDTTYDAYLRACTQRPLVDVLSWRSFENFFLYVHSPWQTLPIKAGSDLMVRLMAMPAAPTRNYWESAPVHRICEARELAASRTQVVGLLLPGLFQNDWTYFWFITGILFSDKESPIDWREDPAAAYYNLSIKTLGKFVGGPFGRFSPAGIDFAETFLGLQNSARKDKVIHLLVGLIDDLSHNPVTSCHILRQKVGETLNKLTPLRAQIGEFTLVIFIKLVGLSGYLGKGVSALAYVYPVNNMGSYRALTTAHVLPEDHLFAMDVLAASLGLDAATSEMMESLLCESHKSSPSLDVFYFGQNLYRLVMVEGIYRVVRKAFGRSQWVVQE
jgi:hypothetical protein